MKIRKAPPRNSTTYWKSWKKQTMYAMYRQDWAKSSAGVWVFMTEHKTPIPAVEKPAVVHHFIVTEEPDGLLVSALKLPNQNKDSYVEALLKPKEPMYERIMDSIAMLNIAGTEIEIEGVGEAFQAGVYHVVVNAKEHEAFVKGVK